MINMPGGGDGAPIRLRPFRLNPKRSFLVSAPTANLIRGHAHRRQASKTKDGLVFPNGKGKIDSLANIVGFGLKPAMIRAGVTAPVLDGEGNPVVGKDGRPLKVAKYTGLHCLRHFFASFCINSKEDGGMALQPKIVQERLGHSSIVMTLDVYGHLFPRGDDHVEQMEAAAQRLLGLAAARISPDSGPGRMQRIC
jgi:integrase